MLLQVHNSLGHAFARGIHPSRSGVIQFHPPQSNNVTSIYRTGLKFAIKHFLYGWLTSGMEAIKAQHGPGACCRRQDYFECHIKSMSSAFMCRIWLHLPMDFVYVCKESFSGGLLEGFFSWEVRRGWGFGFKLSLEKGVWLLDLVSTDT